MKMYNPPGSEARLREMMKGVTGTNIKKKIGKPRGKKILNEDFQQGTPETAQILDTAYEKLKTGALNTDQGGSSKSSSQSMNDVTYVGINGFDSDKNMYNFNFKVTGSEGDQDGVLNVDNVVLEKFYYQNPQGAKVLDLEEKDLVDFNNQHGSDLYHTIQEYITVDVNPGDEMAELQEAVLDWSIDMSDPFGGARQEYQDGPGYGDEKPVNPKLRVKAPELDSFVQEGEITEDKRFQLTKPQREKFNKLPNDTKAMISKEIGDAIGELNTIRNNQNYDFDMYELYKNIYKKYGVTEEFNYTNEQDGKAEPKAEPEGWSDVDGTFKDAGGVMKWSEKEEKPEVKPEVPEEKPEVEPEEEVPTGDVEHLEGGLADGADMEEFDPKQILMGMEVEMEHTDDPSVALEITMDHLKEIPDYYTHLDKMEKEVGAGEETGKLPGVDSDEEGNPIPAVDPPAGAAFGGPGFGAPEGMGDEFKDEIENLKVADTELKDNILGYNTETPNASEENEQ